MDDMVRPIKVTKSLLPVTGRVLGVSAAPILVKNRDSSQSEALLSATAQTLLILSLME